MRIKLFDNYNIGYEEISGDEYGNKIGYDSGNGVFFNNFNSYDEDFTENELQKINRIVDNESYHIRPTSIITDNAIIYMSATYNWSIRPGVRNRYNFSVPAGDDDADFHTIGTAYVALFGDDVTGNGSRLYPFRTWQGAISRGAGNCILSSGTYRGLSNCNIYADGDVTIDNSLLGTGSFGDRLFGFKVVNYISTDIGLYDNIRYNDFDVVGDISVPYGSRYNIFKSSQGIIRMVDCTFTPSVIDAGNNTFINSKIYLRGLSLGNTGYFVSQAYFSIFYNCQITMDSNPQFDYCLFYNCTFRFTTDGSYPGSGSYTPITDSETLLSTILDIWPNTVGFKHIVFGDPLFNNISIGDYTLSPTSPAKNASYIGSFVGAHSIGFPIKASSTNSLSGFDGSTNINLSISEDSITLVDVTQPAQIDSVVIPNLIQREISSFPSYGFNADRNGQYIDSIADLDVVTKNPGDTLSYPSSYIVENGSIDYNGNPIQPGGRFTTVNGVTSFTTNTGGIIREILEAPQRHTTICNSIIICI